MNRDQLLEVLEKHGVPSFLHNMAGGGTIVAAQHGARVLGVFPCREGRSGSAVWINPHIEAIVTGKAQDWKGEGEGGTGGDRLWVSPERNYYYRKPQEFGEWFCPRAMDPGSYETVESTETSVLYRNRFDLQDLLHGWTLHGVVAERCLRILDNPFAARKSLAGVWRRAGYAGFEMVEKIEVPAPRKGISPVLCPWGLTQVPPAAPGAVGTVIVPTGRRASPIGYFGPIPPDRIRVNDDHLIFRIDARRITKLGVLPEDLPADGPVRVAYLRPVLPDALAAASGDLPEADIEKGDWMLIVRESEDVARASADAMDPAKAAPDGPRGVIQSYNSGPPSNALFGEIEIQFPPVRKDANGAWRAKAASRFLAFHGSKADMLLIASQALGLKSLDLFD